MTEKKVTKTMTRAAKRADTREGEAAVLAKIAAMPEHWRVLGERLHSLIVRGVPTLQPTVWYGMPGYAKDGKTVTAIARRVGSTPPARRGEDQ